MKIVFNSKLEKLKWAIKKFGISSIFMKPIRMVMSPFIINFKKRGSFIFEGKELKLFYHRYNLTWSNERAVEIPIARYFINNSRGRILEIGNVMSHYQKVDWDILDKFEIGKGVINEDIVAFKPKKKYDLIISFSTFEHIGYDDSLGNSRNSYDKIIKAFENVKRNCLNKNGKIIITVPLRYNPYIDEIIFQNKLEFKKIIFVKRISKNQWAEVGKNSASDSKFNSPSPYGNCIAVCIYS